MHELSVEVFQRALVVAESALEAGVGDHRLERRHRDALGARRGCGHPHLVDLLVGGEPRRATAIVGGLLHHLVVVEPVVGAEGAGAILGGLPLVFELLLLDGGIALAGGDHLGQLRWVVARACDLLGCRPDEALGVEPELLHLGQALGVTLQRAPMEIVFEEPFASKLLVHLVEERVVSDEAHEVGQEVLVAKGEEAAALLVEASGEHVSVVLERSRLTEALGGEEQMFHVVSVVFGDGNEPTEHHHGRLAMREEVHRVGAHRHLAKHVFALLDDGDERARREGRELSFDARLGGMHVHQREVFVAAEEAIDALIFGGGAEGGEIDVAREAGELVGEPLLVVGAELLEALRPGVIDGAKRRGRGLVALRLDARVRILHVGKLVDLLAVRGGHRGRALADRVLGETCSAVGVGPVDGHRHEGLGHRHAEHVPVPIASHP